MGSTIQNQVYLRLNASERSYFALLKKEVAVLAVSAGFTAKRVAEVDIVVAEMVSNLAKFTRGGEMLVKLIEGENTHGKRVQGIELICMDSGPGITDLRHMMKDGISTANTLGQGLGAIQRLSSFFQVYTQKGWGTIMLSRIFDSHSQIGNRLVKTSMWPEVQPLVVAKPGEKECGDNYCVKQTKDHISLLLGDGLGHGKEAAFAVHTAIEAFNICTEESPADILRFIHESVKATRGLVATVAVFDQKEKHWKICGVGNINTRLFRSTGYKIITSYNGIVGSILPGKLTNHVITHEPEQLLVLCSDGIKTKWDIAQFPDLRHYDLSLFNASLFKEFTRNTDDFSILGCKVNESVTTY